VTGASLLALIAGGVPTAAILGVGWRAGRWTGRIETKVDAHGKQIAGLQEAVDGLPCHECPIVTPQPGPRRRRV
jgi:hypothetical protein